MARQNFATMIGLEAIAFQGTTNGGISKLYEELTEECDRLRALGKVSDASIRQSRLSSIISKHTGISTAWELVDCDAPNAAVYTPQINKNHPLLIDIERAFTECETLTELVQQTKRSKFNAVVDRENCRVMGDFTKITSRAIITSGMITAPGISGKNIASVLLHELGHIYTFYERMVDVVTQNYATVSASQRILKTESPEIRMELLLEYEKVVGVRLDNKDTIIREQDGQTIYCQIMGTTVRERRDINGAPIYSYIACEFVADQFATRHGAGLELGRGLEVLYRGGSDPAMHGWVYNMMKNLFEISLLGLYGAFYSVSSALYFSGGAIAVGTAVTLGVIGAVCVIIAILCINPLGMIYDKPLDRIARIEREYNNALKDRKLDSVTRQYYVREVEGLREIQKGMKNHMSWNEAFWTYLIPAGNRAKKDKEFQQTMEKLSNNNLFAAAAAFN